MSDLQRLRDEAKKAQRRANSKVSRLKTQKGVEISGTAYDVRRDPAKIKRYNTKQLESYISDLRGFTHRNNAYVAGDAGTPLPKTLWNQRVAAQNKYNAIGAAKLESISGIQLPGLNQTIAERRDALKVNNKRADGEIMNMPFIPDIKKSTAFPNAKALQLSIKALEKRGSDQWTDKQYRLARKQARGMLEKIGDTKLTNQVKRLSRDQFDTLWNHSQFISELMPDYLKALADSGQMDSDDLIESMNSGGKHDSVVELISWAKKLPKVRGQEEG